MLVLVTILHRSWLVQNKRLFPMKQQGQETDSAQVQILYQSSAPLFVRDGGNVSYYVQARDGNATALTYTWQIEDPTTGTPSERRPVWRHRPHLSLYGGAIPFDYQMSEGALRSALWRRRPHLSALFENQMWSGGILIHQKKDSGGPT
eukprot:sb/3473707/